MNLIGIIDTDVTPKDIVDISPTDTQNTVVYATLETNLTNLEYIEATKIGTNQLTCLK